MLFFVQMVQLHATPGPIDRGAKADSTAVAAALAVFKHCCITSETTFAPSARLCFPQSHVHSDSSGGWRFVQPVASS
jgi:hypothetical protein